MIRQPLGESSKEVVDLLTLGVENMRAVGVYKHSMLINLVKGIPAYMVSLFNNQYLFAGLCKLSCGYHSCKARSYNYYIIHA